MDDLFGVMYTLISLALEHGLPWHYNQIVIVDDTKHAFILEEKLRMNQLWQSNEADCGIPVSILNRLLICSIAR